MRKVTLSLKGEETDFILLTKDEIAALLSVTDKNPRSHWLWVDYDSETVWAAGATRVMRCTNTTQPPGPWARVPIKAIKELKILQQDAVLVCHPHQDVAELTKVRFPKKGWVVTDGQAVECLPEAEDVTHRRVSVPAPGTTDYQQSTLEGALRLNTGAPVPHMRLSPAHLAPVAKLDAATGKKATVLIRAGHGEVPCLFEIESPDGCRWTYALMPKGK